MAVSLGTILAWQDGHWSMALFIACLCGALCFHAAGNIFNDYFDLKNNVDSPAAPTSRYRPHPVFALGLQPSQLYHLALAFLGIALCVGITLAFYSTPKLWFYLAGGLFFCLAYTWRPLAFKYVALGEIVVFLVFGPLMMTGVYLIQENKISEKVFCVSIPIGLWVTLILLANNFRDIEFDRCSKITTLSTIFGPVKTLKIIKIIAFSAYALIVFYVVRGTLNALSLLVFCSLPALLEKLRDFSQHVPESADAIISKIAFFFGCLLALAFVLEKFLFSFL